MSRADLEKSQTKFFAVTHAHWEAGSEAYKASYGKQASWSTKQETAHRHLRAVLDGSLYMVIQIEVQMGINEVDRWQPDHPKYIEIVKYTATRQYQKALDHLQKLVVQRLFELQKLNVAGTGEWYAFPF